MGCVFSFAASTKGSTCPSHGHEAAHPQPLLDPLPAREAEFIDIRHSAPRCRVEVPVLDQPSEIHDALDERVRIICGIGRHGDVNHLRR
jgi:hypothetical protein